jgi:hypothetical protein
MNFDSKLAAQYASDKLDALIDRSRRDSLDLVNKADVPELVTHFHELREIFRALEKKIETVKEEVEQLSHEIIPNIFSARSVTSLRIDNIGTVIVSNRWVASPKDKNAAINWMKSTGNGSLVIETINASTLAGFAKEQALAGKPLPEDVFTVGTSPYTSIRK